MGRIVVAGSENGSGTNPTTVAVVDASNPAAAIVVMLAPGIGASGARVAIDAGRMAVGATLNTTVKVFDVMTPASPKELGSVNSGLAGGIGAIAVRGTLVAAGEWVSDFGARVALIDASASAPMVVSTATTPFIGNTVPKGSLAALTSMAFLSDTLVVATSPTSGQICLIDFAHRASPVVTLKTTRFAGIGSADADADAQRIAAGDGTGELIVLYDAGAATELGAVNSGLGGIGSLSLAMPRGIAGSPNSPKVALIDFATFRATAFDAQLGGGASAVIKGTFIALGSITGPFGSSLGRIQFFDATQISSPLGHADVALAAISTIAIGQTIDVTASPDPIDFGIVATAAYADRTVTLTNSGSVVRRVTNVTVASATGGTVVVAPLALTLAARGGNQTLSLRFTAGSAAGAAGATLSVTTDDPAAHVINVALKATVLGQARAAFSVSQLDFGIVAATRSTDLNARLSNTGNAPLQITAAPITGDGRLSMPSPMPATVPPGGQTSLTVRFAPAGTAGPIPMGTILSLTSNDPSNPTLPIAGNAVLLLPRTLSLSQNFDVPRDGQFGLVTGSLSGFDWPGGPIDFRLGDFAMSYTSGPSVMRLDLRFVLDGRPLQASRVDSGNHSVTTPLSSLAAGFHTLSVEAIAVLAGGPPATVTFSGTPTLRAEPPPTLPRVLPLNQSITFTGTSTTGSEGAYVALDGSPSLFAWTGAVTLSLGDFSFDHSSGPTTMQLDVRFVVDGAALPAVRLGRGVQRAVSVMPVLAAGSHSVSVEVRTVLAGGPPVPATVSGTPTLSVR